jgi:hypothetical protein
MESIVKRNHDKEAEKKNASSVFVISSSVSPLLPLAAARNRVGARVLEHLLTVTFASLSIQRERTISTTPTT